jgi:hypothetical protein
LLVIEIRALRVTNVEVSRSGHLMMVPAVEIDGSTIIATGRFVRMAAIKDESFVESGVPRDPVRLVTEVSRSGLGADMLTFPQAIDDRIAHYPYFFEWDNVAAADTTDFNVWWEKLPQSTRKNTRRAARRGVTTSVVTLNEHLALGIKRIYDEAPFRQGRRFWHYGKDAATVLRENSSYLERSEFVATYFDEELIGFMKMVYVGPIARIMQILSCSAHYDKRPMNALLAKGVEICGQRGITHLVYSKFQYGNRSNPQLEEFKTRNGFERLDFPRYYVPLTLRGRAALACRLHRGALEILPSGMISAAVRLRDSINRSRLLKSGHSTAPRQADSTANVAAEQ